MLAIWKRKMRLLLALFLSAFLVAAGFPNAWNSHVPVSFLLPFSLTPLFLVVKKITYENNSKKENIIWEKTKKVFFSFWCFGFIVQLFAFFWISQPLIYFSATPPIIAYPLWILICILTSLYFPFLFSPLIFNVWYSNQYKKQKIPAIMLATLVTFCEIIAPRFFNWSFGSLMHTETQINQFASIFGFNGVSFFIFLTSLLLSECLLSFKIKNFLQITTIILAIWGALFLFGSYRIKIMEAILRKEPTTRIAYVQPNFTFNALASIPLPVNKEQPQSLEKLLIMSQEAIDLSLKKDGKKPDLIVWPESAAPVFFMLDRESYLATNQFINETGVPILVQFIKWIPSEIQQVGIENAKTWSASTVITPGHLKTEDFEKWVPMPFGESVPFEKTFPILGKTYRNIFKNASKIEIGSSYQALPYGKNKFVAPLICFDSINPELPRLETLKGQASILVNQANFVWMVKSNAGLEFSILNQFRAVENGRSLIMVSNTGPSLAFDPLGRKLSHETALLTQSTGFFDVPIYSGKTIYSRFSNWPLIILGLIVLLWLFGRCFFLARRNSA